MYSSQTADEQISEDDPWEAVAACLSDH